MSQLWDIVSQAFCFGLGILAIILVARKNRWGFVLGLASQPFWYITTYLHEQWGLFALNIAYTLSWSYGVYQWFFLKRKLLLNDVHGCLSCDIIRGRKKIPGGIISETHYWAVSHCIGPLPVGTLVIVSIRHVLTQADLTIDEVTEFALLQLEVNNVVKKLTKADQVYNCQWSHVDSVNGEPFIAGHLHIVVQPVWNHQKTLHPQAGASLQAAFFKEKQEEVESFCDKARQAFPQ